MDGWKDGWINGWKDGWMDVTESRREDLRGILDWNLGSLDSSPGSSLFLLALCSWYLFLTILSRHPGPFRLLLPSQL